MTKYFLTGLLVCLSLCLFGQQILSGSDYIYKNQMSVGKTNAIPTNVGPSLTNAAAWFEVGKDSTNKGMILPRIVDTAVIINPVKGMFVYQINDHSLYYRNALRWVKIADGATITDYVKISDSTVWYYPLNSNPKGYLAAEADPIALNKTVTLNQGTGVIIGSSGSHTINNNPAFSISADNTSPIWNANMLQNIQVGGSPVNGQVLQFNGAQWVPSTLSALGTVTSVGLSLPPDLYSISGSPVTTTGTLTGTLKNQLMNTVWAAPNGISGAPLFRTLANQDLPVSGVVAGTYGSDSTSAKITVNDRGITTSVVNAPITYRWIKSGTNIFNANLGNVGIGTETPSSKLDVAGQITANASEFRSINSTIDMRIGAISFGAVASGIGNVSSHPVIFATNNLERMRLDAIGRLGIGLTTNISGRLSIGNDAGTEVFFGNDNPANILQGSTTQPLYINSSGGIISLGANNSASQHLNVISNGNVGIGTTTPGYKLELNGTFRAAGNTTFAGNGVPAAGKMPIGTDASGNWQWGLPNTELIAVLDNIDIMTANTYTLIPAVAGKRIIVTYAVYEKRSSTGSGTQTFTPTGGTNATDYDNLMATGSGGNLNSASAVGTYTSFIAPQATQSIASTPVMLKIVPGAPVLTTATIRVFVRYALMDL